MNERMRSRACRTVASETIALLADMPVTPRLPAPEYTNRHHFVLKGHGFSRAKQAKENIGL